MLAAKTKRAQFELRERCVSCRAQRLVSVWKATFSSPEVAPHLTAMGYAPQAYEALKGESFEMVRCAACSMMFHRRVLTDEWLGILYSDWINDAQIDRTALDAEQDHEFEFAQGVQRVKHCLRLNDLLSDRFEGPHRTLDFGCGDGAFVFLLRSFGFDAVGVDRSSTRAHRAHAMGVQIVPSLEDLAPSEREFHAISMFEVLEHVAAPRDLLEYLRAQLAPNGVLIVEVPNCTGVTVPHDIADFRRVAPTEHINDFTPETLRALCRRAGFRPIMRQPAWVTTHPKDLVKTGLSKFYHPARTTAYFEKM